jgi:hypothetical protein
MRRFLANRKDPDADKWLADYMSSEPKSRRGLLRRGG